MAGIKFSLDVKGFKEIEQKIRRAGKGTEHALSLQIAKDTEPYVPAKTKSLANRTIVTGDTIVYPGPYARFLYYGKLMVDPDTGSPFAPKGADKVLDPGGRDLNISTAVHSKAQAHWFEASKAQNLPKWKRVAEKAVKREFRR